jgi:hypothetical protein
MQDLWQRTIKLFREHPILWAPLIIADLSAFFLTWLQKSSTKWIIHWLLIKHYHSALDGSVIIPNTDPLAMRKAAIIVSPLVWGGYFVHICLYTAAFVLTAAFVGKILCNQKPYSADAVSLLRSNLRQVTWFSLKVLALWMIGGISLVLVPAAFIRSFFEDRFLGPAAFGAVGALLGNICASWLLTPAGTRLIQAPFSEDLSAETIKRGRILAILTSAASVVISYFAMKAEASIYISSTFDPAFHHLIVSPLLSLLVAFPYLLLWILLSLLAFGNVKNAAVEADPDASALLPDSQAE